MRPCRICRAPEIDKFLSLGEHPHCNRFLRPEDLVRPEPRYPLEACFCRDCALVQLGYTVPPEVMYLDHPYVSGTTQTLPRHFRTLAEEITHREGLEQGSLVVDIGSNDGTWLRAFRDLGMRPLGVEPARAIARIAEENGIETLPAFFGKSVAEKIALEKGRAQAITAAGVFFHVGDLYDFMEGVRALLSPRGVFVVQAMYLLDIVEKGAFDAIYHEHLCYYSLRPLARLFDRFEMEILSARRLAIHGGSFVIYVRRKGVSKPEPSVVEILRTEEAARLYSRETFEAFARRAEGIRARLRSVIADIRGQGKRILAYGASARGNTVLNYCRLGTDLLDGAVEKNPLKVGLYTPGTRLPVLSEDRVWEAPPEYFLVLAWNFLDEFVQNPRMKEYRRKGGKLIVPFPEPRVI